MGSVSGGESKFACLFSLHRQPEREAKRERERERERKRLRERGRERERERAREKERGRKQASRLSQVQQEVARTIVANSEVCCRRWFTPRPGLWPKSSTILRNYVYRELIGDRKKVGLFGYK